MFSHSMIGSNGYCASSRCSYASRYQSLRFQKVLSQPLSVARSFLDIAETRGRHTTGITTPSSTTMSFIAIKSDARLIGAYSGDCDQPFRPKVIIDSGDRDHTTTP